MRADKAPLTGMLLELSRTPPDAASRVVSVRPTIRRHDGVCETMVLDLPQGERASAQLERIAGLVRQVSTPIVAAGAARAALGVPAAHQAPPPPMPTPGKSADDDEEKENGSPCASGPQAGAPTPRTKAGRATTENGFSSVSIYEEPVNRS